MSLKRSTRVSPAAGSSTRRSITTIVRQLLAGAARAASSGNVQPWQRLCRDRRTAQRDHAPSHRRHRATGLAPDGHRISRHTGTIVGALSQSQMCVWLRNSTERSARPVRIASDGTNRSNAIYQFFNAPVGLFITIDRGLGPGQWADLGDHINTLAFLVRGYGLDTCPQVIWIRIYKIVGAVLPTPARADAVLRDGDWLRRPQPRRQSLPLVAGGAARILHVLWIRLTCSVLLRKLGTRHGMPEQCALV